MTTNADRILHRKIDKLIAEKNFSVSAAAEGTIKPILKLDNLRPVDVPNIQPLVMDGLRYRAKNYKPGAAEERDSDQGDFADIDQTFLRLIYAPVALDEAPGTRRMPPGEMTQSELRKHVALKRRKASQTWSNAEILERFDQAHPEWDINPELTMFQVLEDAQKRRGNAA